MQISYVHFYLISVRFYLVAVISISDILIEYNVQSMADIYKNYVFADSFICGCTDCIYRSVCIQRPDVAITVFPLTQMRPG